MRERPNIVKRHPTAPACMCECINDVFMGNPHEFSVNTDP